MNTANEKYELFFGIVSPVGTDTRETVKILCDALTETGKYKCRTIKLSGFLHQFNSSLANPMREDERINKHMDAGNELRRVSDMKDALAILSVNDVKIIREKEKAKGQDFAHGNAFIFDSLKHDSEIDALRIIYGEHFYVISVYEPLEQRIQNLIEKIKKPAHGKRLPSGAASEAEYRLLATKLIDRDKAEPDDEYGQSVSKTFPKADLFVTKQEEEKQIPRFVKMLFGAKFITPTIDEYGMYFAHAAALRTADPSRQVGATITTQQGEILTAGCNEVPKAGGGSYWPCSPEDEDNRDFAITDTDPNVEIKHHMLGELFNNLKPWLASEWQAKDVEDLIQQALYNKEYAILDGTRVDNIIEFGRVVHAEMHAVTEAARRGISVKDSFLYCTTYPCHMCARHIIAAGIKRIIFIEPYPKSLTESLYRDCLCIDGEVDTSKDKSKVKLEAFIGVSPRQYSKLFKMSGKRKQPDGTLFDKNLTNEWPRIERPQFNYLEDEAIYISKLFENLTKNIPITDTVTNDSLVESKTKIGGAV